MGTLVNLLEVKAMIDAGAQFVPVYAEINSYPQGSMETLFSRLSALEPEAFIFKKFTAEENVTYIGLKPFEVLKIVDGKLLVKNQFEEIQIDGPLLGAIETRLNRFKSIRVSGLPSFQGGAFGYFGYDFVRHLEPRLKTRGYFQVLETSKDQVDAELMLFDQLFIFDHTTDCAFAMSGIHVSEAHKSSIEFVYEKNTLKLNEMRIALETLATDAAKPHEKHSSLDIENKLVRSLGEKAFLGGVRSLQTDIEQGEIFQAVLSDRFSIRGVFDADAIFKRLSDVSSTPYKFHFKIAGVSRFGASPEMLLQVNKGILETHPIAGTRPRGETYEADQKQVDQLRKSVKERAEHLMLVDLARNDLGQVSRIGSVKVEVYREVQKFDTVMHLVSKVTSELAADQTPLRAFASCFPAGTLSGAPKVRAMELIAEIETAPRGFYGGAVVAIGFNGDLDSCIAIRSVEVSKTELSFRVGAGIVSDSKPAKEHEEILHKSRGVREAIAYVSNLEFAK